MLTRYLKSNIGEFVLALISSWCMALVGTHAFFLESAVDAPVLTCIGCAVLLIALYAAAYKRSRLGFGIAAVVVICAVMIGLALMLSTGENIYDDAEGNFLYLAVCIIFSAVGCFLLTRTLAGAAVWFLVVAFLCSVVQAFYLSEAIVPSVFASTTALALIIVRNFRTGLLHADVAQSTNHVANFAASVVPVIVSVLLACAAWFLIIAPLNPSVAQIKLITDYRQLPVVELKGVVDEQPEINLDMTSDNLVNGYRYTTDDLVQGDSDTLVDAQELLNQIVQGGGTSESGSGSESGTSGGLDQDSLDNEFDAMSYTEQFPWILVVALCIVLVVLIIVGLFMLRRYLRRRRLVRMLNQDPADQVKSLYLFLLDRLGRIGFKVPEGATLTEFAENTQGRLSTFTAVSHVRLTQLTQTYLACEYGDYVPTEDEIVPFVAFYLGFWKAARRYLGNFKYFFKSLRLG